MAKKNRFSAALAALLAVVCLFVGVCGGYFGYLYVHRPIESEVYTAGSLQIHFPELGNKYTGDCTYIKAGDTDILIDAGSKTSSIPAISAYLDRFVTDGTLEYVIVTHAHEDHYAGFATNENKESLFDLYVCNTIIDFAHTHKDETAVMYGNYLRELADEVAAGALHYTAKQCVDSGKTVFPLSESASLTILDQQYYHEKSPDKNDENNHSVCVLISEENDHFLFTGDLEKAGEESLAERNDLPHVKLYKAGHHGSSTSSHEVLLQEIRPEICCVCCCAGSSEYSPLSASQFPTQEFIDRIAPYTDAVYVTTLCLDYTSDSFTSFNGNIVVSYAFGSVTVHGSASDAKLKDTEWFRQNRKTPDCWK